MQIGIALAASGVFSPECLLVPMTKIGSGQGPKSGDAVGMRILEPVLADVVEAVLRRDLGIELGGRTTRDARDPSGLAVDFTYEDSGVALEVTTIHDDDAGVLSEIRKLAERLSERFDGWLVVVSSSAHIKTLEPQLVRVLEAGEAIRPGDYGVADLEWWAAEGRLGERHDLHRQLSALGLVDVVRHPEREGVEVAAAGEVKIFEGVSEPLATAVAENAAKLGASRPRETHLVVGVVRFASSTDPMQSSVPSMPEEVDHLWVVHLWNRPGASPPVWHAVRGGDEWVMHDAPGIHSATSLVL